MTARAKQQNKASRLPQGVIPPMLEWSTAGNPPPFHGIVFTLGAWHGLEHDPEGMNRDRCFL
ncbi:hypothetical protein [Pseudochelatococcus contaminans]|uniref:hypothetical protein n=1 Tax=Pseudochelatococcus contaminans TaxID=1538103 RepID=UPI00161D6B18|nr:hypothetical protein [Pseudochelatococcus contaminans]